jgi:hypothetical protein
VRSARATLRHMFRMLGIGVLFYCGYAVATGAVLAKSGVTARTVTRTESPIYFWVVIAIYGGLGVCLILVF